MSTALMDYTKTHPIHALNLKNLQEHDYQLSFYIVHPDCAPGLCRELSPVDLQFGWRYWISKDTSKC